ncbi:hypothetical protein ACTI_52090 [Actinoplanes sp. OR16]|nr:hypothetical protein ACTI_52090 [Actinoplanes sp. OR16]
MPRTGRRRTLPPAHAEAMDALIVVLAVVAMFAGAVGGALLIVLTPLNGKR